MIYLSLIIKIVACVLGSVISVLLKKQTNIIQVAIKIFIGSIIGFTIGSDVMNILNWSNNTEKIFSSYFIAGLFSYNAVQIISNLDFRKIIEKFIEKRL